MGEFEYQLNIPAERAFGDKAQWLQHTTDRVHDRLWDGFNSQIKTALSLYVNDPYDELVSNPVLIEISMGPKEASFMIQERDIYDAK